MVKYGIRLSTCRMLFEELDDKEMFLLDTLMVSTKVKACRAQEKAVPHSRTTDTNVRITAVIILRR